MKIDLELLEYLDKRFSTLETKIDDLYKFRWQIVGGSAVLSVIVGIFMKAYLG